MNNGIGDTVMSDVSTAGATSGMQCEQEEEESVSEEMKAQQKRQAIQEYLLEGEFVYELFAVLVHSGTQSGGHYYAYIKSFEDGKWH